MQSTDSIHPLSKFQNTFPQNFKKNKICMEDASMLWYSAAAQFTLTNYWNHRKGPTHVKKPVMI